MFPFLEDCGQSVSGHRGGLTPAPAPTFLTEAREGDVQPDQCARTGPACVIGDRRDGPIVVVSSIAAPPFPLTLTVSNSHVPVTSIVDLL